MAELATIARPYAEALFKARRTASRRRSPASSGRSPTSPRTRRCASSPTTRRSTATQVFDLVTRVAGTPLGAPLSDAAKNLLRTVIDNGRLVALPEIAAQFHALVNGRSGVSDATIHSAFPIEPQQVADVRRRWSGASAASSRRASSSFPS